MLLSTVPFLLIFITISSSEAKTFENRIVGKPFVSCRSDAISLVAETEDFFEGQIYVKGSRGTPSCSKSYQITQNSTALELKINAQELEKCGFRAWPKPNSKMWLLSGQVIVAFHPTLVTPSDRAFRAHCEFEDFKRKTEIGIENLIQEHELILGNFQLPKISMHILPAGEESLTTKTQNFEANEQKVLNVGDPIMFEWKLEQEHGIFGIQLERCSAESENGKGMKILENGCSLDEELISDTTYSQDFSKIYATSLAFKFPEEYEVFIRCAVRTCVKKTEHLEIINGEEEDLCSASNNCGFVSFESSQRSRRQLVGKNNNNTRTDIIYVNGRFRVEKQSSPQEARATSQTEFCMPDVIYYLGLSTVVICYLITISTTVVFKFGGRF
ncbi:ZP domain-containing protein [Caenorhabditis elegans]|uniref:ZP domain-containing protein n=1 Tax=Caenorhabditis elegans TaxID=6239 RepID=Q7KWZ4_CAEEL|nr:ZP domain-containing protein [Caenorhabditis elegans]CCD72202.2 ZP domain-containing protein [Caenorhabditis elegans]|eukprot:NP_497651.2 CUTiclin-Like [Caenorhabditis elegans]